MSMKAEEVIQIQSRLSAFNNLIKGRNWPQVNRQWESSDFLQSFYSGRWINTLDIENTQVPADMNKTNLEWIFTTFATLVLQKGTLAIATEIFLNNVELREYCHQCREAIQTNIFKAIVSVSDENNFELLIKYLDSFVGEDRQKQLILLIDDIQLLEIMIYSEGAMFLGTAVQLEKQLSSLDLNIQSHNVAQSSATLQATSDKVMAEDVHAQSAGDHKIVSVYQPSSIVTSTGVSPSISTTETAASYTNTAGSSSRAARAFINSRYRTMTSSQFLEPPRRILGKRRNGAEPAPANQRQEQSYEPKRQRLREQQSQITPAQQYFTHANGDDNDQAAAYLVGTGFCALP